MGLGAAESNSRQCTELGHESGQEAEAKVAYMLQHPRDWMVKKHFNLVSWLANFCVGIAGEEETVAQG